MISLSKSLSSKVDPGLAAQVGATRQNTVNPVDQTSSFDIYGRPSALATNYREAVGTDPLYRMCTETAVSRPQYAYYLNPSLGLGEPDQPSYSTMSTQDTLTGSSLGRHNQAGPHSSLAQEAAQSEDNAHIPYDMLLSLSQKRYSAQSE
jgi:hypothetical protein